MHNTAIMATATATTSSSHLALVVIGLLTPYPSIMAIQYSAMAMAVATNTDVATTATVETWTASYDSYYDAWCNRHQPKAQSCQGQRLEVRGPRPKAITS